MELELDAPPYFFPFGDNKGERDAQNTFTEERRWCTSDLGRGISHGEEVGREEFLNRWVMDWFSSIPNRVHESYSNSN